MGNSNNKPNSNQSGDGNDWSQFLQQQNTNQAMNQIYVNNSEAGYINIYEKRPNTVNPNIQTESQKTVAITIDYSIDKDSVAITPLGGQPNIYSLGLKLDSECEIEMYIHWFCRVKIDPVTNSLCGIMPKDASFSRTIMLGPGKGQALKEGAAIIDMGKFQISELAQGPDNVPLIIVLKRKGASPARSVQSMTYYFEFDRKNNLQSKEFSRSKISKNF